MSKRQKLSKPPALMATLALLSTAAIADQNSRIRFVDELESCVTAIKSEIDLEGVNRIRHIVTKSSPQGIGYELRLKVSTYADNAEREYSAYCLVTGSNEPSRLRVTESRS